MLTSPESVYLMCGGSKLGLRTSQPTGDHTLVPSPDNLAGGGLTVRDMNGEGRAWIW